MSQPYGMGIEDGTATSTVTFIGAKESPRTFGALAAALAKAQKSFGPIKKSRTAEVVMKSGGKYSYDYADLAACFAAVRDALADNGLSIVQPIQVDNQGRSVLLTVLLHESGEYLESTYPLPSAAADTPQSFGSALTFARRYSLTSLLGIASEDDDDGKAASARPKPKAAPAKPPEPETTDPPDLIAARHMLKSWAGDAGPNWKRARELAQSAHGLLIENLSADQLTNLVVALKGGDEPSGVAAEGETVSQVEHGGSPEAAGVEGSGSEPEAAATVEAVGTEGAGPEPDPAVDFAIALSSAARESWTPTPEDSAASGDAAQERLSLLGALAEVARSMSWGDADIKGRLGGKSRKSSAAQIAALTLLQLRELVDALEAEATKASEGGAT